MRTSPPASLTKQIQHQVELLRTAEFGTFHSTLKLFIKEMDRDAKVTTILMELQKAFPAMDSRVSRLVTNSGIVFEPDSQTEAAAFGERMLRNVAGHELPPRALFNDLYGRGRGHYDRLPHEDDNDERSLRAFRAQFLEPFVRYLIDALEAGEETLRNAADFDPNVGMLRKEFFRPDLDAVLAAASKTVEPTSVLFIDMDQFKQINEEYGHTPFGDDFLVEVTSCMKAVVKERGTWYRFGGDEFWLLLINHNANEAALLGERIRVEVESNLFSSKSLPMTVTIGVASSPEHALTAAELVSKVTESEREAKKHGRNLVKVCGEEIIQRETPPARKLPQIQDDLDPEEILRIRMNYFQSGITRCPKDSALMKVKESQAFGQTTPDLHVWCPMCGVKAEIPGT